MVYESYSWEDTAAVGKQIGEQARPGDVFCLTGDLGVGKTVFAQGFGRGLGILEDITSPTFSLLNCYEGRLPFYHFDMYRLEGAEDLDELGFDEYLYGSGCSLVEWPEFAGDLLPQTARWITIAKDYAKGENYRRIEIQGK